MNKITVKTTGEFELRDMIQDVDINQNPQEVLETSFVSQMIGLKRLEVVEGKVTQESNPHDTNINPSVGEALPTKDDEPTIKELNEKAQRRGRPAGNK